MPALNFNEMARIDDEAKQPAPSGRYVLSIEKVEWKKSKQGHPQQYVLLRIDEGAFKGKPVFNYLTFNMESQGAISMARNFLNAIGLDFADYTDKTEQQQCDMLLGKRIEAELNIDEWQGRKNNKIKNIIRGITGPGNTGGMVPPPVAPQESGPAVPKNPLAI